MGWKVVVGSGPLGRKEREGVLVREKKKGKMRGMAQARLYKSEGQIRVSHKINDSDDLPPHTTMMLHR